MSAQQTAADLLSAANMIEHLGWHQGSARGPNGEVCAYKAILDATVDNDRFRDAYCAARAHIGLVEESLPLSDWNDAPERTQQEVVSALRGAAEAVFPHG